MSPSTAFAPSVDVVIAIHDPSRPLDRAVESVLLDAPANVRALVVCHGIERSSIERLLTGVPSDRVEVIEFADGVRSAAGPFNAGIRASSADYVSVMGSDDFLDPGALRAWQRIAAERHSDAVIAEQRHQSGKFVNSPPVRPGRARSLDAVRDRLYYRSAPLGLLRRQYLLDHGLHLFEGLSTGEDVVLSTLLWSHGHVDLARGCPRYVIGADAAARVTGEARPLSEVVEIMTTILADPGIQQLPLRNRRSLAVRLSRTTLLSVIRARMSASDWDEEQVASVRDALAALEEFAPGFRRPLALAERAVLEGVTQDPTIAHATVSRRSSAPAWVVPRNLAYLFHRESNVRRYSVLFLDRRRAKTSR